MLTGSDSPRPDQQALAHCTAWTLLSGRRVQLRGRCHSLCHYTRPDRDIWTCRLEQEEGVGEPAWVCVSWLTGIPVAASRCYCLWHCCLLTLTPTTSISNPHPLPPSTHPCHDHYPSQSITSLSLCALSPCSDTLRLPLISFRHCLWLPLKSPKHMAMLLMSKDSTDQMKIQEGIGKYISLI